MEPADYSSPTINGQTVPEPAPDQAGLRSRALSAFLADPATAVLDYPELRNELIAFLACSTNPYMDTASGKSAVGKELQFEQWEAEQRWSMKQWIG